jgi:anion-transporting  ArsA/GET3 family ATPase
VIDVGAVIERHRLVVCVGTGGVGKTTIAAAIALAAARRGRRAIVLTIDPARALARAFGLASLGAAGEPVPGAGVAPPGRLDAAMLDTKQAWDAFVARHAPSPAIAAQILGNRFYQELSTSFGGSTEYMAIEEMCRLAEAGEHDLIVLDTPPAAHALDFLRAPERIDPLLDPRVAAWLAAPTAAAGAVARFVMRRLERAAGSETMRDVAAFLVALEALVAGAAARTRRARALLRGGAAAFVLVAGPRQLVLDETAALAARMRALDTPLAAVVVNRVHRAPALATAQARAQIDRHAPGAAERAWLRATWDDAVDEAAAEAVLGARLARLLPPEVALAAIPDADHDVHSLGDLTAIGDALWSAAPAAELA